MLVRVVVGESRTDSDTFGAPAAGGRVASANLETKAGNFDEDPVQLGVETAAPNVEAF